MPNHPGVYFIPRSKTYHVKMFVQGKQYYLRSAKDEQDAMRAFDAALWKLKPFVSSKMVPNDATGFASLTQNDVDALCPYANELYGRFVHELESQGLSVQSFLEQKKLSKPTALLPTNPTRTPFSRFRREVYGAYNDATQRKFKLRVAKELVDFKKLPNLLQRYTDLLSQLTSLEEQAYEFSEQLESHASLYGKLND